MFDEYAIVHSDPDYSDDSESEDDESVDNKKGSQKKRKQGPIDVKSLTPAQINELFKKEIKILLEVGNIIKNHKHEVHF